MRVKICGITKLEQGQAIAQLGATALGFICVPQSPRYIAVSPLQEIVSQLPKNIHYIGVFVNSNLEIITDIVKQTGLTGVQLHGDESPEFCQQVRNCLPEIELIKAFRIKNAQGLIEAIAYYDCVDTLLLDAYHPHLLGGTGQTLNWQTLGSFQPPLPWFLSGGLNPDNILEALEQLKPSGIDLSSGVERSPGDKNLDQVSRLFQRLENIG